MVLVAGRYELVEQVRPDHWQAISHGAAGFRMPVSLQELSPSSVAHYAKHAGATINHPNIVHIYDLCEMNGRHFLVTEWVDGISLAELLLAMRQARIKPPWPVFANVAIGALRALEAAHEHLDQGGHPTPFVHSHLTPRSVLVSVLGSTKLTPFGDRFERQRRPSGQAYQAPEAATHDKLSPSSDVYALGALLWEMLCGARPFDIDEELLGVSGASTLQDARPDVPKRMRAAIERAIAYEPADRFATASEMATELVAAVARHKWQRGARQDVGLLVVEAREILERNRETFSNPELVLLEDGDAENPILLTNVTAERLRDDELVPVDED